MPHPHRARHAYCPIRSALASGEWQPSRFCGHRFGEGRSLRFPAMHLLDLPILLPLAVAQAPIALGSLLPRDLLQELAP